MYFKGSRKPARRTSKFAKLAGRIASLSDHHPGNCSLDGKPESGRMARIGSGISE
jgi:hypothetical protein